MRYASVDIGTNTLRLLIADVDGDEIKPVLYKRAITRLGGGYTDGAGIDKSSAERSLEALSGFREDIDAHGARRVIATATSVVRRARNKADFLERVHTRAGLEVTVIDGAEEAMLSLLGVLSVVGVDGLHFVFDIGGGSTEYILSEGAGVKGSWSLEMGVVHLTETHLKSDPPAVAEVVAMEAEVASTLGSLVEEMGREEMGREEMGRQGHGPDGARLVGTAGTITTLAAIDLDLEEYDRDLVNNHVLTRAVVEEIYNKLLAMTVAERSAVLSLEKGREDLIIPGTAITLSTMDRFGFEELTVSDAGLLEGLILREVGRSIGEAG